MSMRDEETNELGGPDHQHFDFEMDGEQNEDDEQISQSQDGENVGDSEDDFERDSAKNDDSAETEPMCGESYPNFEEMMNSVATFSEELEKRKVEIDSMISRLNGYSNLYKIENLVNLLRLKCVHVRFFGG
jgi:hypothetical protein